MSTVRFEQLQDVATVIMGQSPPGDTYNEQGLGLPFFQGKAEFGDIYPTAKKWCTAPTRIAEADDILISVRAPVGPTNIAKERCCIGRGLAAIRANRQVLDRDFLVYYLKFFEPTLVARGQGSTFTAINKDELVSLSVPVLSILEQHHIVDILKRADSIRRLRKQAIQTARELIPALFVDMFGDPATNPKGWVVQPLGDLVDVVSGATPSKKRPDYWVGNIPWVSPKDMKVEDISDSEDHLAESVLSETNIKMIPPASILVVVRGMILAHTVPIRINSVSVTINQDMKALVPRKIRPAYLRWAMQSMHAVLLKKITTAGHGTRKLDTEHIVGMKIGVPPLTLQDAFEERVKAATSITGQHNGSLDYMERLFQGLLARAFRGEL